MKKNKKHPSICNRLQELQPMATLRGRVGRRVTGAWPQRRDDHHGMQMALIAVVCCALFFAAVSAVSHQPLELLCLCGNLHLLRANLTIRRAYTGTRGKVALRPFLIRYCTCLGNFWVEPFVLTADSTVLAPCTADSVLNQAATCSSRSR